MRLMDRPNVLILMSDQHHPRLMGHAGEPAIRTPNLDRLAAAGVGFSQAYCPAPLCVPSRMAFLTGRFPSDIAVWTNRCVLGSHVPTFAHGLSLAGWRTTLCGRMHFTGPDQHHGFQRRLVGDVSGAADHLATGLFEGVWSAAGCGQSYEGLLDDAVGPGQATYAAYDDAVTERACELLHADARGDEGEAPFCTVVGMLLPHNPYVCPGDLFEEYMDRLAAPHALGELPGDEHPAVQALRRYRGVDRVGPEQARRARAAYFGMITLMDRNIGRVLDALEATGLAERTAVLYTSDHGDLAGEHGLWWKDSFYEGSVGVPMIWSWPGRFRTGHRADAVVSLLDVAPTLIDLAGAEPLPGARGRSLLGLLKGEAAVDHWPSIAFAETCAEGQRPARMVRSGRWKLNVYHGYDRPQLFDLVSDLEERHDLGADAAFAEVRRDLLARVADGWSGEWVERQVRRRVEDMRIVQRWKATQPVGESERWAMRPGMNLWVFIAAFTPIPYKVFTIAAGVAAFGMESGPWTFFAGFLLASALGRAGRFFLVSGLIYAFGEPVKRFIDKYFDWCALAFAVLLIGAFFLLKHLF